jgi:hypothetical protein
VRFLLSRFSVAVSSILLLLWMPAFAQQKFTISGYIKDAATGEALTGANVFLKETMKGTTANQYGFYSFTIDKGKYNLVVSFLGYEEFNQQVELEKDLRINVSLKTRSIVGKEVEITGTRSDQNVQSTEMGKIEMDIEQIRNLPAFMGEVDIMKSLQLMPGIQSAGEGNAGFYVRGGGPDQNLILLDEAVVYNASHLFGFFSVFNSDAVKNIELTKGGMTANYGGRLASVIDVSLKEGNNQELKVDGGIGLIASRLTIQGPIKKDTASYIISARRTYIDAIASPFIKSTSPFKGSGYYFYDLNTKINYKISDKDRIFLSGYFGRDVFSYRNKNSGFNVDIPWGNATGTLRWNHLFNDKLFMNASAIFSDYNFEFKALQSDFEFKLFSGIRDWNGKVDFSWFPSVNHQVKFGANYIYHTFTPSNASARQGDVIFDTGEIVRLYAHESAIYVTDEFDITDRLRVNAGIRYSQFMQVGPFDRFIKDERGNTTDTIFYRPGELIKNYGGPEPRLSARYTLNSKSSVKAAYTRNYQYIHLASLSAVSLPTDVWMPSTSIVRPQLGTQYSVGYFRNLFDNKYETSVELYYKDMQNQVEYKEGYLPEDGVVDNPDQGLTFGRGTSYGAEFFIKKRFGKINGWVGYTLSKTTRLFPNINNGLAFPAKFDRRHDLSVVLIYDLSKKWTFSAIFVYGTGNAITLPIERYFMEGNVVNEYGPRNAFRMAPYHRADISATWNQKTDGRFRSSWNFSVFNVYNRYNPYFIYFTSEGNPTRGDFRVKALQVSLFPILPSVTWNFSF